MTDTDFRSHYLASQARFESLAKISESLIQNTLRQREIDFLSASSRTKTLESCIEKIQRKSYRRPESEITDIVGSRIIVYFEHQIESVSSIIRELFSVDEDNSYDQSKRLGRDRIGYRSNHFVCTLGDSRKSLSEYRDIFDIPFEVQVRTILQHAWAELAHDRSYKLSAGLPGEIQREVNLYAGLLEISDKAFSRIVSQIDKYVLSLEYSNIYDEEVNIYSIKRYIELISDKRNIALNGMDSDIQDSLADEMKDFGIKEIKDLVPLFTEDVIRRAIDDKNQTPTGMIRDALMWSDLDRYLSDSWKKRWNGIEIEAVNWLQTKYPNAASLFDRYSINIFPPDFHESSDE